MLYIAPQRHCRRGGMVVPLLEIDRYAPNIELRHLSHMHGRANHSIFFGLLRKPIQMVDEPCAPLALLAPRALESNLHQSKRAWPVLGSTPSLVHDLLL